MHLEGRSKGERVLYGGIKKAWQKAREDAGPSFADLKLYDGKKTAVREMKAKGMQPKHVAAVLGHRGLDVQDKHYNPVEVTDVRESMRRAAQLSR